MNSFRIAILNFKRNIRTYGLYIMAMIFSVATYYNFLSMYYNPQFMEAKDISIYIQGSVITAAMLMIMFFMFFIMYSGDFFLNQRKKEIGVYAFMGIDNHKIALIFASEGLLLGLISLVMGLFMGVLFSKLFMMVLAKVALLNIKIDFFISKDAIVGTVIAYSIILAITFVKGYLDIVRTNLIDLLNSLKREEEIPKVNYFKGIASIIIIGVAYYMAVNYAKFGFGRALIIIVFLIVWGTYWLFGSFFSMIMRRSIGKKDFLYRGVNIISISNIVFRIKNNYRTLAAVAVLITTCITSFGTVTSLKYYVEKNHKIEVPYTVTYISSDDEEISRVKETIENSNYKIELDTRSNFLYSPDDEVVVVNPSTLDNILSNLEVSNRESILPKGILSKDEAVYIERPGTVMSLLEKEDIVINDKKYDVKDSTKAPVFGSGLPFPCIVVNEEEYEVLKTQFIEQQFNGIILDNPEDTKDLTLKLAEVLPMESRLYTYFLAGLTFYDIVGVVYFIGAFLFLVFVFATGSIIYFKTLSESFRDKNKYEILKKLGMTDLEIRKAVSKQVGMFFILPLIVGIVHSMVAISVLSDLMKFSLMIPTATSIGVFALMYGLFYVFTRRKFIAIVE